MDAPTLQPKKLARTLIYDSADKKAIKAIDKDGWTPLHEAARAGSEDIIWTLIKGGADVKVVDKDGRTPLHEAARAGSEVTTRRLINHRADVNAVDNGGRTSLHEAARAGSEDIIWTLIKGGADVGVVDKDGRTPLHEAAGAESDAIIQRFIACGADINAVDKDGRTPLHEAAQAGSDTTWILIKDGADVKAIDKDGRTPLHEAAQAGSDTIVPRLIARGADVNAVDKDGQTPLHEAAQARSRKTIQRLMLKGADIKTVDKDGRTPLHEAARAGSEVSVQILIASGADVKAVDKDGRTPLHDAARVRSDGVVCLFIHTGVDVTGMDNEGRTAFEQYGATVHDLPLKQPPTASTTSVLWHCKLNWRGLRTYEECNGALGEVLSIWRTQPQGHCYLVRPISEYLEEFHCSFGLGMLGWIMSLCERSLRNPSMTLSSHDVWIPKSEKDRESPQNSSGFPASTTGSGLASRQTEVNFLAVVKITALLKAQHLTVTISAKDEASMFAVKTALLRVLAVLQPRKEHAQGLFYVNLDKDFLKEGMPEVVKFKPVPRESYCWMGLFSYAVILDLPPSTNASDDPAKEGLEIDLDLLTELAAVDREIQIDGCVMKYGVETALVPLMPVEGRRWHFLSTPGRQITPHRVKVELYAHGLDEKFKLADHYETGKVYVGWCCNPVLALCTDIPKRCSADTPDSIAMASGVGEVEELERASERSSSKDASFQPRIGFLGSSLSFSGGTKREKKFKQISVVAKRTAAGNYENVITLAQTTPCVLWDQESEKAWLFSAASVLAFATLRYVEWKRYLFKKETSHGQFTEVAVNRGGATANIGDWAVGVLRQNELLVVSTADNVTVNENITFKEIVRMIWEGMSVGEDVCSNDVNGRPLTAKYCLYGYDLSEAICGTRIELRELKCNPTMRSWKPLISLRRTPLIFTKSVGDVIICKSKLEGSRPTGSLCCLFVDLKFFYGERWPSATTEILRTLCSRGLPLGDKHEWVPKRPAQSSDGGCDHQALQSVTVSQKETTGKLQKRKRDIVTRSVNPASFLEALSKEPTLLTFGIS
ncbi:hypothetical protein GJ744_003262 [Endocarpon pusillum]|uniref:Uncharacterized protein n=1 Tax=Endocarpon pusillum TaxID=364733 RepID=A0A8H7AB27_9EURO|nr:hypothetical protein GJ744_003262 [Endocarpon pusillum]